MSVTTLMEIKLNLNPWPDFLIGSYRFFDFDEKHVTRICKHHVLLFLLEGTLYFSEDGEEIEVKAGEWYLQLSGKLQEGKRGSPSPKYYYIHFQAEKIQGCNIENKVIACSTSDTESLKSIYMPLRGNFDSHMFIPIFDQLDHLSRQRPLNHLGQQSVFLNILNMISSATNRKAGKHEELISKLMNYLSLNYNMYIDSNMLSHQFHFSTDYLTRMMKKYYGITPWQYVQQLRIEKAKELLANTDQTLSTISENVGYSDLSVFYKAFYKHNGIAPGVWRQINRGFK